jgi:hypothetical protein
MSPEIFGPQGLLIAALSVIVVLWRDHLRADQDDRNQRDKALGIAESAVAGTSRMADAWEARNREDAQRRRQSDS